MEDIKYNSSLLKYFKYDPKSPSGLVWIAKYSNRSGIKIGAVAGSLDKKDKYWRIHGLGSNYKAHKIVWGMHNNFEDQMGFDIDHKDRNRENNSPSNLRLVPHGVNTRNRSKNKNNSTGAAGVSYSIRTQSTGKLFEKYTAIAYTKSMKKKSKSFSVQKYGKEEAFRLASEWRVSQIEALNSQGFGYSDGHGKE